jgi:hypothetical protein
MPDSTVGAAHRYGTFLRFYVATMPQAAEAGWQAAQQFERLSPEQKEPGHWYRYTGEEGLIEVQADRSGEWHADGKLPEGVDPAVVVEIPPGEPAPTLLDNLLALLEQVPATAPNHAQIAELMETLKDLPTQERATRLVKGFQKTLASVPPVAEEQIRFLEQASQQMVGTELLAGKVRGYDAAGVLMVTAIAREVAKLSPQACSALLAKAAAWDLVAVDEMAARLIDVCWGLKLSAQLTAALDWLRGEGEKAIESARTGLYPEGHPELVLEIYYGGLLQAVPYLLGANSGYYKLSKAPNLSEDDLDAFQHKADTSEEKLVRMTTALQYAAQDVELSRLASKQAQVADLMKKDPKQAEALVREIIDLEFFYPPAFKAVLMADGAASPGGTPAV